MFSLDKECVKYHLWYIESEAFIHFLTGCHMVVKNVKNGYKMYTFFTVIDPDLFTLIDPETRIEVMAEWHQEEVNYCIF